MPRSNLTVRFQMPRWHQYTEPFGRLVPDAGCQALWYYNMLATQNWKKEDETVLLEDDPDINPNYEQLFRRAALMYGANIETMANYWPLVDAEIDRQNVHRVLEKGQTAFKKLPELFRFTNRPIKVKKSN